MTTSPLLEVHDLVAGYGGSRVLDGVNLTIRAGEALTLLGRNGVGKTTFVHTVMGIVRSTSGACRVDGRDLTHLPAHVIAKAGVGIVPQGRRVFAPLTVEENLSIVAHRGATTWTMERVYELMPQLAQRRSNLGSQLSGGEQQMLAIGRALLTEPRLLLLDEPSDGLAPAIVDQVAHILLELVGQGLAVLLVEQDLHLAFRVADRVAVMQKGRIVHEATTPDFRRDGALARELLGVG